LIKTTKDGRTIREGKDYTIFRWQLWERQTVGMCARCHKGTSLSADPEDYNSFHVHHVNGRGMGGGKRDDTFEACVGLCGACHRKEHGQGYSNVTVSDL
jgi:hypothetical protein